MIIRPTILIVLTLLGMVVMLTGLIPSFPVAPSVHASPPNNPATIGIFHEVRHSNSILGANFTTNTLFKVDVNLTDAGLISGFDVNITFTGASIVYSNSTYGGPLSTAGCTTCILRSPLLTQELNNQTNVCTGPGSGQICQATGNPNWYRLQVADTDSNTPFVNGNGILFRVTFKVVTTNVASAIHIDTTTRILNPSAISYNAVDGYFDNRSTAANFSMSLSLATVTITRPVLSTDPVATGTATVTISGPTGLTPNSVTLSALSMPINTGGTSFGTNPCTTFPCSSILTVSVHGGSKTGATTTPSGTYSIPVTGSAIGTGVTGSVVRVIWLKLVINPPAAPVFTITPSLSSFTQEAGSFNLVTLTVSKTSGANDSIALSNNCTLKFPAGTCTIKPGAGSFPLTATMNVSSRAAAGLGVFKINATATTGGTYSEIVVVKTTQITVTIVRTHDLQANNVQLSRNFGYNAVPLPSANQLQANVSVTNKGTVSETFIANATAKTILVSNANLKYVDTGGNTSAPYKANEPVVLDNDGNGLYGYGKYDSTIKFAGPGSTWVSGNAVVYDANGDGKYDVGKFLFLNDTMISGSIANNTALKPDQNLKIVDCTNTGPSPVCDQDGAWNCLTTTVSGFVVTCTSGEPVFYDTNSNGVFDTGETVIFGTTPTAEPVLVGLAPAAATALSQSTMSFVDGNYNGQLVSTDAIAFDSNGNGVYDAGEVVARGTTPSAGIPLGTQSATLAAGVTATITIKWDPGSLPRGKYIIAGWAVPVSGEFSIDNNVVFSQSFTERFKADVNGDCFVDVSDFSLIGASFFKTRGQTGYNNFADITNAGIVDVSDLAIFGSIAQHGC